MSETFEQFYLSALADLSPIYNCYDGSGRYEFDSLWEAQEYIENEIVVDHYAGYFVPSEEIAIVRELVTRKLISEDDE